MILHTRVVSGSGGGPEKTILQSPAYVAAHGMRCAAAYIHPDGDDGIDSIKQRADKLDAPLWTIPEKGAFDPRTFRALLNLCRRENVAVWHGHDYKSNLLGLLIQRFYPMKLVTTAHGWTNENVRTRVYYRVDNHCLPRYDQVIAVSPKLQQHCRGLGIDENRLHYIPNAIDTGDYRKLFNKQRIRWELGVPADQFIIGVVGRLSMEKGVDRAIDLINQLQYRYPNVRLHLVGDGPLREDLQQQVIKDETNGRVRFWGWQRDARRYYEAMDMLLLPSHSEGLPNVVLEAMAMNVPVAATNVGGVGELLDQGRCGVILDNADTTHWADHIEPLIVSQPRREELARRARKRVEEHYSFAQRMQRVIDVYGRVLDVPALRRAA